MNIIIDMLSPGNQALTADEPVTFWDVDGNENTIACHIDLVVRKSTEAIYIHADLRGEFNTACHRCLEPARVLLEPSFDVVAKKTTTSSKSRAGEDEDDDLIFYTSDDRDISLKDHVYENLVASIPIRILCSDDCKGLCPVCGANLNFDPCRCVEDAERKDESLGSSRDA